MLIPYDQKTNVLSVILTSKLNTNQLSFLMYLYRITFECKRLETRIPSLNDIADSLLIDQRNFRRDVADLLEQDIITRKGKEYGFNLDFEIIAKNKQALKCKKLIDDNIHISLERNKKG